MAGGRDRDLEAFARRQGREIRRHRKRLGLTQEALAQRVGVTAQSVSKWERGSARPRFAHLASLERNFGGALTSFGDTREPGFREEQAGYEGSGGKLTMRDFLDQLEQLLRRGKADLLDSR